MLPARGYARLRLRKGIDFRAVYSTRRSRGGRLLVLHWRPTALPHPRVGFSVSTKVGNAVERNRLKRCLKGCAWPLLAAVGAGVDLVVVVRPAAAGSNCAELSSELRTLLTQVLGL